MLGACEENGNFSLINTKRECKKNRSSIFNQFNNTLSNNEINPVTKLQIHNNTIFDFDWCSNDNKIITASGDMSSQIINLNDDRIGEIENILIGHTKSIKCVKQAFYNENIFTTCGRDGMIFVWDLRSANKRLCTKHCDCYESRNLPHLHVIN